MTSREIVTLREVVASRTSMTGYELGSLVQKTLTNRNEDAEDITIATELDEKYFSKAEDDNVYKPLKFVYYRVIRNRDGEYLLRRNFYLSPRATGYFTTEDETTDELRQLIRTKEVILGKDLKRVVADTLEKEFQFPTKETSPEDAAVMANTNLSIQLAEYINSFFIDCEKPLKDDIWYGISCKEYATATVYRDLTKSPRKQK